MKSNSFEKQFFEPQLKDLSVFKGMTLKEVVEYMEGPDGPEVITALEGEVQTDQSENRELSIFDGFLMLLREKGVRASTPEWLQFLSVLNSYAQPDQLRQIVSQESFLNKIRLFAMATLVKDKAYESAFHEAFDEYFEAAYRAFSVEAHMSQENTIDSVEQLEVVKEEASEVVEGIETEGENPDLKEQLGIKEVDDSLDTNQEDEHEGEESVHGGKKDQHNDILTKKDKSKIGGGKEKENENGGEGDKGKEGAGEGDKGDEGAGKRNKGEEGAGQGSKGEAGAGEGDKGEAGKGKGNKGEPSGKGFGEGSDGQELLNSIKPEKEKVASKNQPFTENGYLVGGGKGNSLEVEKVADGIIKESEVKITREELLQREAKLYQHSAKAKYERRPERRDIKEIVRNLKKIILDVSEMKTKNVRVRETVKNFAKKRFRFEYEQERERQPEIVLFIDVGGPVDEWSPIIKEVSEEMTKGLTKLEVYLFHNQLYGYVWKPDKDNFLKSSYAEPDSLIDIKKIVKKRKKVIIYGDAEMSGGEFQQDYWTPQNNEDRVENFAMQGPESLKWIKKHSDATVWINPIFKKEWRERDDSGTISSAAKIIPMHDMTIGGVQDAIKELMN